MKDRLLGVAEVSFDLSSDSPNMLPDSWHGSCLGSETTLHQISPYIGKMKSTMAKVLISKFSSPGDIILDPFVGSGVVALESLIGARGIICNDVNPYAMVLTKAKLSAPDGLHEALTIAEHYLELSKDELERVNLESAPEWVRCFFHPRTLRETLALTRVLQRHEQHFLLACLLGILHHQRPGFLSYPASHAVPYLRTKRFPKEDYPEMYRYRAVRPRLLRKIQRVYRRFPEIDHSLLKKCFQQDATKLNLEEDSIDAVITSPPYMNALDYVRDNRLRLWFIGNTRENVLNKVEPMNLDKFKELMRGCFAVIHKALRPRGRCIFVTGEISRSRSTIDTARAILDAAQSIGSFDCENVMEDNVPRDRRIRRNGCRVKREWIIVLRKRV
jgi:adenine-specific DNA methylase